MSSGDKMGGKVPRRPATDETPQLRRQSDRLSGVGTIVRVLSKSALLFAGALGAAPELPALPEESSVELEIEPSGELDAVSPVVRLRVPSRAADPATLRLFRDELSDYHVGRLRAGELPGTLLEREVPMIAWGDEQGANVRPLAVLDDGVYSLASPELGSIGAFRVSASSALPLYARLWPPEGSAGSRAVYCGEPRELTEVAIELEPQGPPARLVPGLGALRVLADRCLSLELDGELPPGIWLGPPATDAVLLDPAPLTAMAGDASASNDCAENEMVLGAGCAIASDDGVTLRAEAPLLWVFVTPAPARGRRRRRASSLAWAGSRRTASSA